MNTTYKVIVLGQVVSFYLKDPVDVLLSILPLKWKGYKNNFITSLNIISIIYWNRNAAGAAHMKGKQRVPLLKCN